MIGYSYNADGTLSVINAQLNATTWAETDYTYDDYKSVLSLTDPTHNITRYWYDKAGNAAADLTHTDANVTRLVLPSIKATQTLYDNNLRKVTVIQAPSSDAATTTYTYDAVGNLKTVKQPESQSGGLHAGAQSVYNYDARNRLLNVTDPVAADRNSLGYTINYTYDLTGNKLSERGANDQITNYNSYDAMNRLTQMTVNQAPSPAAVSYYTWTKAGKLDTFTDPNGNLYDYNYDRLNRLITIIYPGSTSETRTYDFAGNLLTFKNRNGNTQTFTCDARNRETYNSMDDGVTPARALIYDDASRLTSCNATAAPINFTYYDDNRLKSQEEWTGYFGDNIHRTLTYTYDSDKNRATAGLTDGTTGVMTLVYAYTNRNQLYTVKQGSTTWGMYGYDLSGNMSSRQTYSGINSNFAYDAAKRLTDVTHPLTNGSKTFHYTYDEVGNRLSAKRNTSNPDSFTYDKNSQLLSFQPLGGTAVNYTLDAGGNRSAVQWRELHAEQPQ